MFIPQRVLLIRHSSKSRPFSFGFFFIDSLKCRYFDQPADILFLNLNSRGTNQCQQRSKFYNAQTNPWSAISHWIENLYKQQVTCLLFQSNTLLRTTQRWNLPDHTQSACYFQLKSNLASFPLEIYLKNIYQFWSLK